LREIISGYGVVSDTTAYHFKAVVSITPLARVTSKPKHNHGQQKTRLVNLTGLYHQVKPLLLHATTVVFGNKEVCSASERITIKSCSGITGHKDITIDIGRYGEAKCRSSSNS